jgi:hypothetical protein
MRIAKLPLACRPTYSAWSQAFWQFRISQSAFRISPTSLLPYLPAGTSNREQ